MEYEILAEVHLGIFSISCFEMHLLFYFKVLTSFSYSLSIKIGVGKTDCSNICSVPFIFRNKDIIPTPRGNRLVDNSLTGNSRNKE